MESVFQGFDEKWILGRRRRGKATMNYDKNELLKINEIGQIVAKSIVDFWIDNNNLTMVNNCLNKGAFS